MKANVFFFSSHLRAFKSILKIILATVFSLLTFQDDLGYFIDSYKPSKKRDKLHWLFQVLASLLFFCD